MVLIIFLFDSDAWNKKTDEISGYKKSDKRGPGVGLGAWLTRNTYELSKVMKIVYFLIEIRAIRVYVFVQTHKTVYIKYVYFILCAFYFSEVYINQQTR